MFFNFKLACLFPPKSVFCTYQKLTENQERRKLLANTENIGYGLGVTP